MGSFVSLDQYGNSRVAKKGSCIFTNRFWFKRKHSIETGHDIWPPHVLVWRIGITTWISLRDRNNYPLQLT